MDVGDIEDILNNLVSNWVWLLSPSVLKRNFTAVAMLTFEMIVLSVVKDCVRCKIQDGGSGWTFVYSSSLAVK